LSNLPPPPPPPPPQFGQPGATPQWTGPPLASWGQRVLAALIDYVAPGVVVFILFAISKPLGYLADLGLIVFAIWNLVQQGNTGQTIGKKQVGIRLLREDNGQVVGPGLSIARAFVHIIDGIPCYIGYLFPLWDPKRQTLADKILHTVVIVG
jgi:uncharacterized RDD family membrane protein YckC